MDTVLGSIGWAAELYFGVCYALATALLTAECASELYFRRKYKIQAPNYYAVAVLDWKWVVILWLLSPLVIPIAILIVGLLIAISGKLTQV